jgi:hypothetical protein
LAHLPACELLMRALLPQQSQGVGVDSGVLSRQKLQLQNAFPARHR